MAWIANDMWLNLGAAKAKETEMNKSNKNPNSRIHSDHDVDVIVLGVGTCGEDLSLRLLRSGLKVIGIEAALVGGECAYWACLPSKMMIRAANVVQEARRVEGKAGLAKVTADWGVVEARGK
jgi:pyruvate/2-oxoglutarate dehydrogenase complex dihydrolipoamide dehydrogenase (E3) component